MIDVGRSIRQRGFLPAYPEQSHSQAQASNTRFAGIATSRAFLRLPVECVLIGLVTQSLPYSVLLPELQLESTRQLEDLIIDVIYSGLLGGKMHHHRQVLHVDWVAGRDVDSQSLSEIQKKLQNW